MVEKHRNAVDKVLKLAKIINYDVDNLKCRKIDIHQRSKNDIRKCAGTSAVSDVRRIFNIFKIALSALAVHIFLLGFSIFSSASLHKDTYVTYVVTSVCYDSLHSS